MKSPNGASTQRGPTRRLLHMTSSLPAWVTTAAALLRDTLRLRRVGGPLDENELEAMQAWSISARLAAASPDFARSAPEGVARLIREARDLHPQMARGADDRAARGEQAWERTI